MSYNSRKISEFDDEKQSQAQTQPASSYNNERDQSQRQRPSLYEHYQQQMQQQQQRGVGGADGVGGGVGAQPGHEIEQTVVESGSHQSQAIPSLTNEDIRILRSCNRESFYYRCLPLSATGCFIIYFLSAKRNVKPRAWQYMSTAFAGWFIGKISYRKICEDKLAHSSSNSPLVEAVRKRRGMYTREFDASRMPTEGEIYSDWDSNVSPKNRDQHSSIGISEFDSDKNTMSSFNSPRDGFESDEKQTTQFSTSYDDLRAKNRSSFGIKL